jgi:hypothetical protein
MRTVTNCRHLRFPNQDVVSQQPETNQQAGGGPFFGFGGARNDSAVAVDSFCRRAAPQVAPASQQRAMRGHRRLCGRLASKPLHHVMFRRA